MWDFPTLNILLKYVVNQHLAGLRCFNHGIFPSLKKVDLKCFKYRFSPHYALTYRYPTITPAHFHTNGNRHFGSQIAYLRGKRYETEKKIWGGQGGNRFTENIQSSQVGNSVKRPNTGVKIADEYGVGKSTIYRNADFSKAVDILPKEVKSEVLSGEVKITHDEARAISKMDKPTQNKFIKEVESGTPIKEAVKKVDPEQARKSIYETAELSK